MAGDKATCVPTGSSRPKPNHAPRFIHAQGTTIVFARSFLIAGLASAAAVVLVTSAAVVSAQDGSRKAASVLDFQVKDIDGKDVDLAKYKGKVLLIVNTASQCGYTPQYKDLQAIYEKYSGKGFEILAFPANEFGAQEPGTNSQIKEFCSTKYNVGFPLFSKIVVKGPGIHPLYGYLTSKQTNPQFAGDIPWNFTKFLVNRKGEVVARFAPKEKPNTEAVIGAIEKAISEK